MMLQLRLIETKVLKETFKEKQKKKNQVPFPTVIHNIDGPNISANEVMNIAPGSTSSSIVTSEGLGRYLRLTGKL